MNYIEIITHNIFEFSASQLILKSSTLSNNFELVTKFQKSIHAALKSHFRNKLHKPVIEITVPQVK